MAYEALSAETVLIRGHLVDQIDAYRPVLGKGSTPCVGCAPSGTVGRAGES